MRYVHVVIFCLLFIAWVLLATVPAVGAWVTHMIREQSRANWFFGLIEVTPSSILLPLADVLRLPRPTYYERWATVDFVIINTLFIVSAMVYMRPTSSWTLTAATSRKMSLPTLRALAWVVSFSVIALVAILFDVMDWPILYGSTLEMFAIRIGIHFLAFILAVIVVACVRRTMHYVRADGFQQRHQFISVLTAVSAMVLAVSVIRLNMYPTNTVWWWREAFTSMVYSMLVLLWCYGVWAVLNFVRPTYERLRLGHFCQECDYDLQGSPQSGSCPECGTKVDRPEGHQAAPTCS